MLRFLLPFAAGFIAPRLGAPLTPPAAPPVAAARKRIILRPFSWGAGAVAHAVPLDPFERSDSGSLWRGVAVGVLLDERRQRGQRAHHIRPRELHGARWQHITFDFKSSTEYVKAGTTHKVL